MVPKPYGWHNYSFLDKLKWYTEIDKEKKELYSDKYKIKSIIERMNIPNLHYAKLISHLKPLDVKTKLNIGVPIQHELVKKDKGVDTIIQKYGNNKNDQELLTFLSNRFNIKEMDDPATSYVIKLNLSWNTMIIVYNNEIIKVCYGKYEFPNERKYFSEWSDVCLFHYRKKTPPRFFAEEFLDFGLPVYEFYCIFGKPHILSVYLEAEDAFESNFMIRKTSNGDYKFELLENKQLMPNTVPLFFSMNDQIANEAAKIATHFAKEFHFVRVDFYQHNNKVYFSECTFTPGALKKIKWGSIGKYLSSFWV